MNCLYHILEDIKVQRALRYSNQVFTHVETPYQALIKHPICHRTPIRTDTIPLMPKLATQTTFTSIRIRFPAHLLTHTKLHLSYQPLPLFIHTLLFMYQFYLDAENRCGLPLRSTSHHLFTHTIPNLRYQLLSLLLFFIFTSYYLCFRSTWPARTGVCVLTLRFPSHSFMHTTTNPYLSNPTFAILYFH